MPTTARSLIARDPIREMEAKIGVWSLDDLQAERATLVAEAAPIRARRDAFEGRRKERRSAISVLITREMGEMSEAKIERLSAGDSRYKSYLDDAELEYARLGVLEDQIQALTEKINRGNALIRYSANEPK